MAEHDKQENDNEFPAGKEPETADWNAFAPMPDPRKPDEAIDPSPPPRRQKDQPTKNLSIYFVLSILVLLLLIGFVAWVWVSDHFGIGFFGLGSVSSAPSSSQEASSGEYDPEWGGGWQRPGGNQGTASSGPGTVSGGGDSSGDSSMDGGDGGGGGGGHYDPPASSDPASSESDYRIVVVDPDSSEPDAKRPENAVPKDKFPEISEAANDQAAVNTDKEGRTNRPIEARLEPADKLTKSYFLDTRSKGFSGVYMEFVSDDEAPGTSYPLNSSQDSAVDADASSREVLTSGGTEHDFPYVPVSEVEPWGTATGAELADVMNVVLRAEEIRADGTVTAVATLGDTSRTPPQPKITLGDILKMSRTSKDGLKRGMLAFTLPEDAEFTVHTYRVKLEITMDESAGNQYQGVKLGGDIVWQLGASDLKADLTEGTVVVAGIQDPGGNSGAGGANVTELSGAHILVYIPAWDFAITFEMLMNFLIATLLCFGFLLLIAKSRKINDDARRKDETPTRTGEPHDRPPPKSRPPNHPAPRAPVRAASAARRPAPAHAGMAARAPAVPRSAVDTSAYEAKRAGPVKRQFKSSLVFIFILISLIVGFSIAAITWKAQEAISDNAILGSTIKPIIYAGETYIPGTGTSRLQIPVFEEMLEPGEKAEIVREFHILNTGTSEFKYRVYLTNFTSGGKPLAPEQALADEVLKKIQVRIYTSPEAAGLGLSKADLAARGEDPDTLLYDGFLSSFQRDKYRSTTGDSAVVEIAGAVPFAQNADGGPLVLKAQAQTLGQVFAEGEELPYDKAYWMRLDLDETPDDMQYSFTIEVEAVQNKENAKFDVLD